jgi:hypothetical protein
MLLPRHIISKSESRGRSLAQIPYKTRLPLCSLPIMLEKKRYPLNEFFCPTWIMAKN